ncbi:hypothetical protein [Roseobacter sp. HKCCA0434]|uniref:hypothetical protein n=1 Tax=Roseobacter sp. HKCCA0434 TaxID=3079297 RepID=UPI002905B4A5|nr:hypothetical protein [Roseobacter sp. HKCCA0434]
MSNPSAAAPTARALAADPSGSMTNTVAPSTRTGLPSVRIVAVPGSAKVSPPAIADPASSRNVASRAWKEAASLTARIAPELRRNVPVEERGFVPVETLSTAPAPFALITPSLTTSMSSVSIAMA